MVSPLNLQVKIMKPHWIAAVLCLFVVACGEEKHSPAPTPAAPIMKDQREALDKARGVEQTLDKRAHDAAQQAEQQ